VQSLLGPVIVLVFVGDLCDDVRFLSNLPWLKELPSDVVTRLALRSHKRDHSKGTLILSEGSRTLHGHQRCEASLMLIIVLVAVAVVLFVHHQGT
jgi:hypothetical protein